MKRVLIFSLVLALSFVAFAGTYDNGGSTDNRIPWPIQSALGALDTAMISNDLNTGVSGGRIIYGGSGSSEVLTIEATSNSDDGTIKLYDSTVQVESGLFIHNEDSGDFDFRVESNGQTHMLFIDAGNDRVGIANNAPATALDVTGTATFDTVAVGADATVTGTLDVDGATTLDRVTAAETLEVTGAIDANAGATIDGAAVTINEDSGDYDFRVESNANTHALFVDAGNDRIGIGTNSPSYSLEVNGTFAGNSTGYFTGKLTAASSFLVGGTAEITNTLEAKSDVTVTGALSAATLAGNGAAITGLATTINTQIDAYSYNSAEINLFWTAFKYRCDGPSEKLNADGTQNAGFAVANGTAVVGVDTMEIWDNNVRTAASASAEVIGVAALTDLYNTSECYVMLSYDGGVWTYTQGASVEVGSTVVVPAVPSGDSPVLLLHISNNTAEAFNWGTDNWDKAGVTTTSQLITWPASGASVPN